MLLEMEMEMEMETSTALTAVLLVLLPLSTFLPTALSLLVMMMTAALLYRVVIDSY